MSKGTSEPGAFTLVSAVNGSAQGLTYEPAGEPKTAQREFEEKSYGAEASGRSALSANGQEVAFVTTAVSNLDGPGTPALQVAVRNLPDRDHAAGQRRLRPRDRRVRRSPRPAGPSRCRRPKAPPPTARSTRPASPPRSSALGLHPDADRSARRSAPMARRSPGWARTSARRRRRSPKKACRRATPSRCGGASPKAPKPPRGGSPGARTRPPRRASPAARPRCWNRSRRPIPARGRSEANRAARARRPGSGRAGPAIRCRSSARTARPSRSSRRRRRSRRAPTSARAPKTLPATCSSPTWLQG